MPEPPARPLWSVMIPTFNCGRFLPQAIASVLAQAPSPNTMQIEVIDDHSTVDDPEKIAEEVGGGVSACCTGDLLLNYWVGARVEGL